MAVTDDFSARWHSWVKIQDYDDADNFYADADNFDADPDHFDADAKKSGHL